MGGEDVSEEGAAIGPTYHLVATLPGSGSLPVNGTRLLNDWASFLDPIGALRLRGELHLRGLERWWVGDHFAEVSYDALILLRRAARDDVVVQQFRDSGAQLVYTDLGELGDPYRFDPGRQELDPSVGPGDAYIRSMASLAPPPDNPSNRVLGNEAMPPLLALALDSAVTWGITRRGHYYFKRRNGLP